jgi:hypothetical protein
MAQKLEHLGLIVFIDVPTQLPDRIVLCQRGPSYPCSTSYERYIETLLQGATTPTLLIFDKLTLFEWIGHPRWMFHA